MGQATDLGFQGCAQQHRAGAEHDMHTLSAEPRLCKTQTKAVNMVPTSKPPPPFWFTPLPALLYCVVGGGGVP